MLKVGKYLGLIKERPYAKLKDFSFEDEELINQSLEKLVLMLKNFDWGLVGGISLDLLAGKFSRDHSDIDILLDFSQRDELFNHFHNLGYGVYRKFFSTNTFKRRFYCYQEVEFSNSFEENDWLWLMNPKEKNPYLASIDMFFKEEVLNGFNCFYHGQYLYFPKQVWDKKQVKVGDFQINIQNLEFQYFLKKEFASHQEKSKPDILFLEKIMSSL